MAHNETPSTDPKNIIILGGSFSGVSIAHYLLKHAIPYLPNKASYQVIIISASSTALCRPACPRALISDSMFPQHKLFAPIPDGFTQYLAENFRFIHGTATNVDHASRSVTITASPTSASQTLSFYALIIATGVSTISPLFSLNLDESSLRSSWTSFRTALRTAKSIVIAGGGPTGIETAGELGEYLNSRAGRFSSRLPSPKVRITVVTAGPHILPLLRPALAKTAEDYLAKVGVTVVKNTRVTSVVPAAAGTEDVSSPATVTLDNGDTLDADLYIPATGARPNTSFLPAVFLTETGHVATNDSTLRVDAAGPRIYGLGDVASYARPAIHLIFEAVPVLGANVKRDLMLAAGMEEGTAKKEKVFKEDKRESQLVPIGRSKGVGALMGYAVPSLVVWGIKGRDYWLWTTGGLWKGKPWGKEA